MHAKTQISDDVLSTVWSVLGPFTILFTTNMFFVSRSPGIDGIANWFQIPAANVEATCYWGAVGGSVCIAVLAWFATAYANRRAAALPWWVRLPPTRLETEARRSPLISKVAAILFLVLPSVAVLVMSVHAITADVVRWPSGDIASSGDIWQRIWLAAGTCPWWHDQCFRLGDLKGIEYKPVLSDGILFALVVLATWELLRLGRGLWKNAIRRTSD